MKIRLHYNKFQAANGLPWTLHTSKKCHSASHVKLTVPVETEENPEKKSNPRYFLVCNGEIEWDGTGATINKVIKNKKATSRLYTPGFNWGEGGSWRNL